MPEKLNHLQSEGETAMFVSKQKESPVKKDKSITGMELINKMGSSSIIAGAAGAALIGLLVSPLVGLLGAIIGGLIGARVDKN
jgi:hypothetical protein